MSGLRGLGSLHSLLGRDPTKRGRAAPSGSTPSTAPQTAIGSPDDAGGSQESAEQAPAAPGAGAAAAAAAAAAPAQPPPVAQRPCRPPSPLKTGNVRCPVCNWQLPNDDAAVNSHIGELQPGCRGVLAADCCCIAGTAGWACLPSSPLPLHLKRV